MSKHEGLHVGDVQIADPDEDYPDELIVVFQDDMRRQIEVHACEDPASDDSEPFVVTEYAGAGGVIAERLDVLGVTEAVALEFLDSAIDRARASQSSVAEQVNKSADVPAESVAHLAAEAAIFDGYSSQAWIADVREAAKRADRDDYHVAGNLRWLLDITRRYDPRVVLRTALLAWPDELVRLDLTYYEEIYEHSRPAQTGCADALEILRTVGAAHAPMVVLTEGRTDVRALEPALELLYPHLTDLVRFMDYEHKPEGGAGQLVNTVKAFAAAGIANRIVALFDNDAAASNALRALDRVALPGNIRILQYPRLALAERYPTLGPPSAQFPDGRVDVADVNGSAASIELGCIS